MPKRSPRDSRRHVGEHGARRRAVDVPVGVTHAVERLSGRGVTQTDVDVLVEVLDDLVRLTEEFLRRTRHGAAKHAHGVGDVGPSLRRAVEQGTHDALVLLEEHGIDFVAIDEGIDHHLLDLVVARRLVAREGIGHVIRQVFLTGSVLDSGKAVSDYFRSAPCLNEIRRGHKNGIPIVFLLETDPTHGGVSLETHRRDCPHELLELLDSAPIVEWHRVQAYQDISLRRLAREVLHIEAAD